MTHNVDSDVRAAVQQRIEGFALELQTLRHDVGRPSYDLISRDACIGKSTLSRAFAGKSLPSWPTTAAILAACGQDKESTARWRTRWSEISKLVKGVPPSRRENDTHLDVQQVEPAGVTARSSCCVECGAQVLDPDSHQRWHRDWVRRPERSLKIVGEPFDSL